MKFIYEINKKVPKGSWCATLTKGNEECKIEAGEGIEFNNDFFVYGVWDDDFSLGNFNKTNFSCCTGGSVKNCKWGGVEFSTPSHMLESLYGIKKDNTFFISNSIPMILKRSGLSLDPNYMNYQRDLCSSMFGMKNQITSSPLKNGYFINYFRNCNIEIDINLNFVKRNHILQFEFNNYEDYLQCLKKTLSKIQKNATDDKRKIKFNMITTISKGYDAAASSALAREIDCKRTLSFNQPIKYEQDCGLEIARNLGYSEIFIVNGDKYLIDNNLEEIDSFVNGSLNPNLFSAFKDEFENSLIFKGNRGDSLWERNHENINNNLDFTNGNTLSTNDHTEIEFALKINSVFIPVPLITGNNWESLNKISDSEEMKKWSVSSSYDRPIPRRILEEKGIKRNAFGFKKMGMGKSLQFESFKRIRNKISKASFQSLMEFKKDFCQSKFKKWSHFLNFYFNEFPIFFNYIMDKIRIPLKIKKNSKFLSSPYSTLILCWSVEELKKKY